MELGKGSTVTLGSVAISNCKSIEMPALDFKEVESTHLGTSGNAKTFVASPLADHSELTVEALYDPTNFAAVYALVGDDTQSIVAVIHGATTSKTMTFTGWLKSAKVKVAGSDELDMVTYTFKSKGAITLS